MMVMFELNFILKKLELDIKKSMFACIYTRILYIQIYIYVDEN